MTMDTISYNGLTLREITEKGFPYHIFHDVENWQEFTIRKDGKVEWFIDKGLINEEDFFSDIFGVNTDDPTKMGLVELWAFKDADMAMLFKLSW